MCDSLLIFCQNRTNKIHDHTILVAHPHFGRRYGCGGNLILRIVVSDLFSGNKLYFCVRVCVCDFYFVFTSHIFCFPFSKPQDMCTHGRTTGSETCEDQNYLAIWDFTNLLSLEYGQVCSKNSQTKPSRKISLSRNSPNSNTPAKSASQKKMFPSEKSASTWCENKNRAIIC